MQRKQDKQIQTFQRNTLEAKLSFHFHYIFRDKATCIDYYFLTYFTHFRSSRPEMFLRKNVLKICSRFTGERPCRSVISIKLLCNFIEIVLRYGCFPAHFLHIFRATFPKDTSGWLLLSTGFCFAYIGEVC